MCVHLAWKKRCVISKPKMCIGCPSWDMKKGTCDFCWKMATTIPPQDTKNRST